LGLGGLASTGGIVGFGSGALLTSIAGLSILLSPNAASFAFTSPISGNITGVSLTVSGGITIVLGTISYNATVWTSPANPTDNTFTSTTATVTTNAVAPSLIAPNFVVQGVASAFTPVPIVAGTRVLLVVRGISSLLSTTLGVGISGGITITS
jgi:hypothetical protein